MKKNTFFAVLILVFLVSCMDKQKNDKEPISETTDLPLEKKEASNFDFDQNEILKDWLGYYKSQNSEFSLNNFTLVKKDTLTFMKGNVFGSFEEGFDSIYLDFVVYNSDKTQYIDFDSYQWSLDENSNVVFSPDQEINIVNIKDKTVTRIGFYGPSFWVENAFWKDGSTVVLLENNDENRPTIKEIDLKKKTEKMYKYNTALDFASKYPERRYREKGLLQ